MSKIFGKLNLKALLTLTMIFTMSLVLAFAVSCGGQDSSSDSSSESSSESESASDVQTIANGDFEWKTTSSSSYPVSSSTINWTRKTDGNVTTALTSTSSSGIIDTEEKAYDKMSSSYKPVESETDGNKTYYNPGTPNSKGLVSPSDDTEVNEAGTKILMVHNVTATSGKGTAQYFQSSSSMTLAAGKYAKVSIWIQTYQLKSLQNVPYGAYIQITNTIGSSTAKPLTIKNINTEGEWRQFVVYLAPSDTAVTKFGVKLGLGFGSKYANEEYAEGYAYFDNIEYTVISADEYNVNTDTTLNLFNSENNNVTLEEYGDNELTVSASGYVYVANTAKTVKLNLSKNLVSANVTGDGKYNDVILDSAVKQYDAGYASSAKTSTVNGIDVEVPAKSVYMNFSGAKIGSSYTYTTNEFTLAGGKTVDEKYTGSYMKFSFYVKAKTQGGTTDASVAIVDAGKDSTSGIFSSFNTNAVKDSENNGYVKYTFYIGNTFPEEITFRIRFSFGPTERVDENIYLPVGYAIFKDFVTCPLSEAEYTAADVSTDTKAVKCKLLGSNAADYVEDKKDDEEDDYSEITGDSYSYTVKTDNFPKLADGAVDLENTSYVAANDITDKTVAGIVNSYFSANYVAAYGADVKTALDSLKNSAFATGTNLHVQPYMILNKTAASYGFRSAKFTTLSANSSYVFSVKVKVTGNAKAYIYLVENIDKDSIKDENGVKYNVLDFNDKQVSQVVTSQSPASADGYVLVTFIVTTGNESKDVRLEMWNGSRDGNELSAGAVFYDAPVIASSATYSGIEDVENSYVLYEFGNYVKSEPEKIYYYYDSYDESATDNSPVYDDDGAHKYEWTEEKVIYASANAGMLQYYNYTTINADKYVIEESDSSSSSDSTSSESTSKPSLSDTAVNFGWLQITSLIISLVLIVLLVVIVVQKIVAANKKKKAKTETYYAGYDKKNRYVPETPDDKEKSDYNYDDIESNVDSDNKNEEETEDNNKD